MTRNSFRTGLLLTLALALLALPALAQEKETMTAPPWGDAGAKIHFGDEDQGTLQVQYKGQFRLSYRDIGSGPDGTDGTTNFGFRRNRLAFMGGWSDKVSLYVQMEFADPNLAPVDFSGAGFDSNAQLLDAAVRFSFSDAFKLNVGRFKYNFSRENLEACEDPLTLDRSLFIRTAYVGTRDDGVALWGNLFGDRFQYRVDAMEGRQAAPGTVAPSSGLRYSARGHVTLLDPENTYGYKGTYLGKKKVLTVGAAYQMEPEVTYVDPATKLGNEGLRGLDGGRLLRVPARRRCRHRLGRLREGRPRRRLHGRQPRRRRHRPRSARRTAGTPRAASCSPAPRCSSSAATRSGALPASTTCSTRSSTGTGSAPTTTSGART